MHEIKNKNGTRLQASRRLTYATATVFPSRGTTPAPSTTGSSVRPGCSWRAVVRKIEMRVLEPSRATATSPPGRGRARPPPGRCRCSRPATRMGRGCGGAAAHHLPDLRNVVFRDAGHHPGLVAVPRKVRDLRRVPAVDELRRPEHSAAVWACANQQLRRPVKCVVRRLLLANLAAGGVRRLRAHRSRA